MVGVNGPVWTQNNSAFSKLRMDSKEFVKLCTMKGTKKHMKFILVIFAKKDPVEDEWVIVNRKMLCAQISESAPKDLSVILQNGRGEEAYEN